MEELNRATSLVLMPHPILAAAGREIITSPFEGGETIGEYLDRNGIVIDYVCILTLDGVPVPPERWDVVCPRSGQVIEVRAVTQGGGGSDMKRAVLTIAVLVAASYGQTWAANIFGSSLAGGVAAGVIAYGGMSLVNKIAPLPQQNLGGAQGVGNTSPTYALSGGSNRARPYEPLPLLYGTHRIWPDVAARSFTEFEGEDQYLYLAFNFGLGKIELDTASYKIGDTLLTEFDGVTIYPSGVDGVIDNFPGNVDSISGDDLTAAAGWITRTSSTDTTALGVDLAGQLFYAGDNGITSRRAEFEIQYRKIDGPVTSLHEWQSYGVTTTFTHYWSKGYYDPKYPYGWVQLGYTAEPGDAHTDNEFIDFLTIEVIDYTTKFGTPHTVYVYWRWLPYAGTNYRRPPQTRTENPAVIYNDNRQPVRKSYRIDRIPAGQYEVRVQRVTADETSDRAVSDFSWSALRSYQIDTADYTGQTRLGMRIKASAQLNGQVDKFNALVSRSVQTWSGTDWMWAVSSNPAWVFLDFARGAEDANGKCVYGAGISYSEIDLDILLEWASFCDSYSLTFNGIFDRAMSAGDALDAIAAAGRATRSMGTGKLGVVWEVQNAPAVAVYGMPNIKAGSFKVEYLSDSLADEVEVSFINSVTGYQPDTVRASAPGVSNPTKTTKLEFFGCTDSDMAGRFANLAIARNVYQRRRISWETDIEGLVVQKGEVVQLSHDLTQWGYSGRLAAGTTTALTLDKSVPFTPAQSHYITVRQPNGAMSTHAVDYVAGETDSITLSTDPLPVSPDADRPLDFVWFFAPQATPGKRVKIIEIKPVDENTVRLIATDDDAAYYAAEGGSYVYTPPVTLLRSPAVSHLQASETVLNYVERIVRVHITWSLENTERARIRIGVNGGNLRDFGEMLGGQFDYNANYGDALTIEVSPVAVASVGVDVTQAISYTVGSYTLATLPGLPTPPDVMGVELSGVGSVEGQGINDEYTGRDIKLQWWDMASTATEFGSDPTNGDSGGRDPNFDCYVVRVYHGTTLVRTAYPRDNAFNYLWELNAEDGSGTPLRNPRFAITMRNLDGEESTHPAFIQPNNPVSELPTGVSISGNFQSIGFKCSPPTDLDWAGIRIWVGTSTGFERDDTALVYDGPDTQITITRLADGSSLTSGGTYYLRFAGFDAFGKTGLIESAEYAVNVPVAITSEDVQSLIAEKIATGDLGAELTLGGVFIATGTEAVINGTGPAADIWRLEMGPVSYGGTTYVLRFHNGSGSKTFSIDSNGNAEFAGSVGIDGNYGSGVWINSPTFGNDGIQLEYNSGNPRAHIGNSTAGITIEGNSVTLVGAETTTPYSTDKTNTLASTKYVHDVVNALIVNNWIACTAPEANSWRSVTWSPERSLFVAVAWDGTNRVMTSPDGITWTARTAATVSSWISVTWSQVRLLFVAVSFDGKVMTSPDGITWTARIAAEANWWTSVTWSPERLLFVAVASNGTNRVMSSPDGITWTARTATVSSWASVTWSPEKLLFVAVANSGTNRVMTSPDGITWTARTAAEANSWTSVTWSPDELLFVAVASDGTNRVMTSPDGITWTARTAAEDNWWSSVAWSPERLLFVAVAGSSSNLNRVMTSHDGITWTARQDINPAGNDYWTSVIWSPQTGKFVAVGYGATTQVMRSLAYQE